MPLFSLRTHAAEDGYPEILTRYQLGSAGRAGHEPTAALAERGAARAYKRHVQAHAQAHVQAACTYYVHRPCASRQSRKACYAYMHMIDRRVRHTPCKGVRSAVWARATQGSKRKTSCCSSCIAIMLPGRRRLSFALRCFSRVVLIQQRAGVIVSDDVEFFRSGLGGDSSIDTSMVDDMSSPCSKTKTPSMSGSELVSTNDGGSSMV